MLDTLGNLAPVWCVALGIFGLCIGSFLNLVALRLPVMLEADWQHNARTILDIATDSQSEPRFNLVTPRSRCPACGYRLGTLDLIPILSYALLKGRCRSCRQHISIRYPVVEATSAGIALLPLIVLSPHQAIAASIAGWLLLTLTMIDFDRQWLPDVLTWPLLWLGLLANSFGLFVTPASAILGAAFGYLSLRLIAGIFQAIAGKEGMGQGDFKLFAAAGAWLGWSALPAILLIAASMGLLFAGVALAASRLHRGAAIAFGPWLALSFWISLLWGAGLADMLHVWAWAAQNP